jgi:hypothetical protein
MLALATGIARNGTLTKPQFSPHGSVRGELGLRERAIARDAGRALALSASARHHAMADGGSFASGASGLRGIGLRRRSLAQHEATRLAFQNLERRRALGRLCRASQVKWFAAAWARREQFLVRPDHPVYYP